MPIHLCSYMRMVLVGTLLYACLIVYGSLFPLDGWARPERGLLDFLWSGLEGHYSQSDFIVNLLAYIPLGFLFFLILRNRLPAWSSIVLASLVSSALSLSMEVLQGFLPVRVSSVGDWMVNSVSATLGSIVACLFHGNAGLARLIAGFEKTWIRPGRLNLVGVCFGALAFTMLVGALAPAMGLQVEFLLSGVLHVGNLTVLGWLEYVLVSYAVLVLIGICLRPDKPVLSFLCVVAAMVMALKFFMAVLFLKVPPSHWSISLKALLALACSMALAGLLLRHRGLAWLFAVAALVVTYVLQQTLPWTYSPDAFKAMNLLPFAVGHMHGSDGFLALIDTVLMFLVLGLLFAVLTPSSHARMVAAIGGLAVLLLALGTEWLQQYMPGRYPDLSDIVLALFGWSLAWVWSVSPIRATAVASGQSGRARLIWLLIPVLVIVVAFAFAFSGSKSGVTGQTLQVELSETRFASRPAAEQLEDLRLTNFRFEHPRLPAPTEEEILLLRERNPAYLDQLLKLAQGGEGQLEAAITMAFMEPGSQDIDRLFERLMSERFVYRGNGTELVARGYDWLYHQLSDEQRIRLREHVFAGFDFTYAVMRGQRLSPYNVFWYNSPFQRLLAAAIVLYDESERGTHAMQVAHHMLKGRMLPVWRQVMGGNGGWHEGGEYVAIGVGQAVWRVPAMWRRATGEDLFATETYLRGFLDFLIYRQRPDSSNFRWGDARYFDSAVPDRYALAFEYQHLAAMWPRPPAYRPVSWPWGPLIPPVSEESVKAAMDAMPLSRLFDGVGMLVARSDWTPDATYLSYKAGNNYWSHSHLDQGAFTLFKGGPLAIDSGLYGPGYGSDHHMNYTYQSIAHNTITVFDPADDLAMRRSDRARPIANDGGQRRVGSGWAEYGAPADLDEWQRLEDIYRTGRIVHVHEDDEFAIVVSDITAAYTNQRSGQSTFHHRTRRVERAWRTLAYDRVTDVVVVYDDVSSTKPEFRKRWLLHTLEEPVLGNDGFKVWVTPGNGEGRAGGRLEGHVIYPQNAQLVSIGGSGFEFFVDGINYDENGEVARIAAGDPRVEPGAWRIEVMPAEENNEDRFLVVMFPRLIHESVTHRVERLKAGERVGVLIEGSERAVRWWFRPGQLGVEAEVRVADGTYRSISLK